MSLLKRVLTIAALGGVLSGPVFATEIHNVNDRLQVCKYNGGPLRCYNDLFKVKYTNKIELLTNQVTLANGRTVSDRLRICGGGYEFTSANPCRVYLIQDKSLLPDVQNLVKTADSMDPSTLFDVNYTMDDQMYNLKVLTAVYVRPTKATR